MYPVGPEVSSVKQAGLRGRRAALPSGALGKSLVSCLLQLLEVEQSVLQAGISREHYSPLFCSHVSFVGFALFTSEDPVLFRALSGYSRIISPS